MNPFSIYTRHDGYTIRRSLSLLVDSCNGMLKRIKTNNSYSEIDHYSGRSYELITYYDVAEFGCSEDMLAFKLKHGEFIVTTAHYYNRRASEG